MSKGLTVLATLALIVSISFSDSYSEPNATTKLMSSKPDDESLFLTPYIESDRIEEAQQLATVSPMIVNIKSFAGYLTVNKTCNSNLFFWLFKSQQGNWKRQPLVVWLQGGIAETSLYGLFRNVGPFFVNRNRQLKRRRYSWNRRCNIVFIDNPVGAGYSFTKTDSGYPANIFDVARDLYEALIQLHKLFPTLNKNQLVIAGESYGTKYAVAITHMIYKINQISQPKLNLDRLILASAVVDPYTSIKYSSYLSNLGLIDKTHQLKFFQQEEELRAYINTGDYASAAKTVQSEVTEVQKLTGFRSIFDFVHDDIGLELKATANWFLNRTKTKTSLHVGDHKMNGVNMETITHMKDDLLRSVKSLVEELLTIEFVPIMFLHGQLDIVAAYSLSLEFFHSLNWPHAKDYYTAKRCQFRVGKKVAAYYKTAGTLTEGLVRNTGHIIAASEPKWTFELMDTFITNGTYFQCV